MFKEFANNCSSSTSGLPFFINKIPRDDLIGLELGVGTGFCVSTLLQQCFTIKKFDLVDCYEPYHDYVFSEIQQFVKKEYRLLQGGMFLYEEDIRDIFSGLTHEEVHDTLMNVKTYNNEQSDYYSSEKLQSYFEEAKSNIISTGFVEKCKFHIMRSDEFLKKVPDDYYDFIFLDSHLTYKQLYTDLEKWVPKVKNGGLISGHDYACPSTWWAVENYRKFYGIEDKMYKVHNDTFAWYKGVKTGVWGL